jgi:hypothetical protein
MKHFADTLTRAALRVRFVLLGALLFGTQIAHAQSRGLDNPLKSQDIPSFIAGALKALVVVALPIITLFIVIAGFMFVLARGNPEGIKKAKQNFVYVIIGAILILGAWVLATLIGGTVTQVVGQ